MSAAAVSSTTGYINYVYNVEAKGVAQFSSQILGASSAINNMLGQLAFQTSAYLSRVESATMSMGVVASAGLYKATEQAIKFDYAMQSVQAIAGNNNIGDLGDQAMQMSNKFGVAVDKMVKGLESLARAGVSPQNMSGILEQAMGLSKLEDLDLNSAINNLLSTTNLLDTQNLDLESPEYVEALKYQNQKITATSEAAPINAQDIIHTLEHVGGYASSTNIDQDDLYAVIAQLGSKGTKSELAGTSLRAFLAAGQKDTAQRALKRLGLSVKDLWKNDDTIMSISDMKDVLDEAMEERGYSKQERLEFYSDFVGYKQANQVMKIDTTSVREYKDKIDRSLDINEKINIVLNTTQTRLQNIFQTGRNFLTKVGEPIMFALDQVLKPISFVMSVLDKIPGLPLVLGITTIFATIKGIAVIFNKLAPMVLNVTSNFKSIKEYLKDTGEDLDKMVKTIRHMNDKEYIARIIIENEAGNVNLDDVRQILEKNEFYNNLTATDKARYAQLFEFNMSAEDKEVLKAFNVAKLEGRTEDIQTFTSYSFDAYNLVNQGLFSLSKSLGIISDDLEDVHSQFNKTIFDVKMRPGISDLSSVLSSNERGQILDDGRIGLNVEAIKNAALLSGGSAYEYGMADALHEVVHNLLDHNELNIDEDRKEAEAISLVYRIMDAMGVNYDKQWRREQELAFNTSSIPKDRAKKIDALYNDFMNQSTGLQESFISYYNSNVERLGLDEKVPQRFAMFGGINSDEDYLKTAFKWNPESIRSAGDGTLTDFLSQARSLPELFVRMTSQMEMLTYAFMGKESGEGNRDGRNIFSKIHGALSHVNAKLEKILDKLDNFTVTNEVVVTNDVKLDEDDRGLLEHLKIDYDMSSVINNIRKELNTFDINITAETFIKNLKEELKSNPIAIDIQKLSNDVNTFLTETFVVDVDTEEITKAVTEGVKQNITITVDTEALNKILTEQVLEKNIKLETGDLDEIVNKLVAGVRDVGLKIQDTGFIQKVVNILSDKGINFNVDAIETKINSVGMVLVQNKKNLESVLKKLNKGIDVNVISSVCCNGSNFNPPNHRKNNAINNIIDDIDKGVIPPRKKPPKSSGRVSPKPESEDWDILDEDLNALQEIEKEDRRREKNINDTIKTWDSLINSSMWANKDFRRKSYIQHPGLSDYAHQTLEARSASKKLKESKSRNQRADTGYFTRIEDGEQIDGLDGKYFFFDIEATSTNVKTAVPFEIGGQLVSSGKVIGNYETLIDQKNIKIPKEVEELTGIKTGDLKGQADPAKVAEDLASLIEQGYTFVAHNAHYDVNVISRFIKKHTGKDLVPKMVDSLTMAKAAIPGLRRGGGHSLGAVAEHYNITNEEAHRALSDAKTTVSVVKEIVKEGHNIEEYVDRIGYYGDSSPYNQIPGVTYVQQNAGAKPQGVPQRKTDIRDPVLSFDHPGVVNHHGDKQSETGLDFSENTNLSTNVFDALKMMVEQGVDISSYIDYRLGKIQRPIVDLSALNALGYARNDGLGYIDPFGALDNKELFFNIFEGINATQGTQMGFNLPKTSDYGTQKIYDHIGTLLNQLPEYSRSGAARATQIDLDVPMEGLQHELQQRVEVLQSFLQTWGPLASEIENEKLASQYTGLKMVDRWERYKAKIKRGDELSDFEQEDYDKIKEFNPEDYFEVKNFQKTLKGKSLLYNLYNSRIGNDNAMQYITAKTYGIDYNLGREDFEKEMVKAIEDDKNNNNYSSFNKTLDYINEIYNSSEYEFLQELVEELVENGQYADETSVREFISHATKHLRGVDIKRGDSLLQMAAKIHDASENGGDTRFTMSKLIEKSGSSLEYTHRDPIKKMDDNYRALLDKYSGLLTREKKGTDYFAEELIDTSKFGFENPFEKVYALESENGERNRFITSSTAPVNSKHIETVKDLMIDNEKSFNSELNEKLTAIQQTRYKMMMKAMADSYMDLLGVEPGSKLSISALNEMAKFIPDLYTTQLLNNRVTTKRFISDSKIPGSMHELLNIVLGGLYSTEMSAKNYEGVPNLTKVRDEDVEQFINALIGEGTLEDKGKYRQPNKISDVINKSLQHYFNKTLSYSILRYLQEQGNWTEMPLVPVGGDPNVFERHYKHRPVTTNKRDGLKVTTDGGEVYVIEDTQDLYKDESTEIDKDKVKARLEASFEELSGGANVSQIERTQYYEANSRIPNAQPEIHTIPHDLGRVVSNEMMYAFQALLKVAMELDEYAESFLRTFHRKKVGVDLKTFNPEDIKKIVGGPLLEYINEVRYNQQPFSNVENVKKRLEEMGSTNIEGDFQIFMDRLLQTMTSANILVKEKGLIGNRLTTKIKASNREELEENFAKMKEQGLTFGELMDVDESGGKVTGYVWNLTKIFENLEEVNFLNIVHNLTAFTNSIASLNKAVSDEDLKELMDDKEKYEDLRILQEARSLYSGDNSGLYDILYGVDYATGSSLYDRAKNPTEYVSVGLNKNLEKTIENLFNPVVFREALMKEMLMKSGAGVKQDLIDFDLLQSLATVNDDIYNYLLEALNSIVITSRDFDDLKNNLSMQDLITLDNDAFEELYNIFAEDNSNLLSRNFIAKLLFQGAMSREILPELSLSRDELLEGQNVSYVNDYVAEKIKNDNIKIGIWDSSTILDHLVPGDQSGSNIITALKGDMEYSFEQKRNKEDFIPTRQTLASVLDDSGKDISKSFLGQAQVFNSSDEHLSGLSNTMDSNKIGYGNISLFKPNITKTGDRDIDSFQKNLSILEEISNIQNLLSDMKLYGGQKYTTNFKKQIQQYLLNLSTMLTDIPTELLSEQYKEIFVLAQNMSNEAKKQIKEKGISRESFLRDLSDDDFSEHLNNFISVGKEFTDNSANISTFATVPIDDVVDDAMAFREREANLAAKIGRRKEEEGYMRTRNHPVRKMKMWEGIKSSGITSKKHWDMRRGLTGPNMRWVSRSGELQGPGIRKDNQKPYEEKKEFKKDFNDEYGYTDLGADFFTASEEDLKKARLRKRNKERKEEFEEGLEHQRFFSQSLKTSSTLYPGIKLGGRRGRKKSKGKTINQQSKERKVSSEKSKHDPIKAFEEKREKENQVVEEKESNMMEDAIWYMLERGKQLNISQAKAILPDNVSFEDAMSDPNSSVWKFFHGQGKDAQLDFRGYIEKRKLQLVEGMKKDAIKAEKFDFNNNNTVAAYRKQLLGSDVDLSNNSLFKSIENVTKINKKGERVPVRGYTSYIDDLIKDALHEYHGLRVKTNRDEQQEERYQDLKDAFENKINIKDIFLQAQAENKQKDYNKDIDNALKYLFLGLKVDEKGNVTGSPYKLDGTTKDAIKNRLEQEGQLHSSSVNTSKKGLKEEDALDVYRGENPAYKQAQKRIEEIQAQVMSYGNAAASSIYGFAEKGTDESKVTASRVIFSDLNEELDGTLHTLRSWSAALYDATEAIPGLSVAVLAFEQVVNGVAMVQKATTFIDTIVNMGATANTNTITGKLQATIGDLVGTAIGGISEILMPVIVPLAAALTAVTAGFFILKGALDWSYESHEKYVKSLEEEQKENRSKSRALQATVNQTRTAAEKNRNPIKQAQRDRRYDLARTQLDSANMTRAGTAIDMTRAKNDIMWGDYGISAGLSKLGGNYESTADQYEGTSMQARRIKEATLANPFSTGAMLQSAGYYDANQLAFGQMDEYKTELGSLYDEESRLAKRYGSVEEARDSPQFEKAISEFVEATGITRDHAEQYLDYMQSEHNVEQARIAMQAQADKISSETEMQVQAIAFGGNPADVLGLNGIEAQQNAMVKAQADLIQIELSGQLFWKAVWATITSPLKLITVPILMISDILGAIFAFITGNWDNAAALGGRAISRLNVTGEAAAYWSAWGQVESTDFNEIGQSNIDEDSRANYGNGPSGHENIGRSHGTNLIQQQNQKKGGLLGGLFGGKGKGGAGSTFKDHKNVVRDNSRNSFFGGFFGQILGALAGIASTLTLIVALIAGGGVVKGLIGMLGGEEGIKISTESIKNAFGSLGGKIGKIFEKVPGLNKINTEGLFSKLFNFKDIKKSLSNISWDNINLDNIKERLTNNPIGSFISKLKEKGQDELDMYDYGGYFGKGDMSLLGRAALFKRDASERIDTFKEEHPTLMNTIDNYTNYGQNKAKGIKNYVTNVGGKWGNYIQDKMPTFDQAKETAHKYVDPWKEYAKNQVNKGYGKLKDRVNEKYIDPIKEEAEWYRNGAISKEDASPMARIMAKGMDIKDRIGLGEGESFKEMLKDPQKMEDWAKGKVKNYIGSYGSDTLVGRYRDKAQRGKELLEDPEKLEEWAHGKLSDFRERGKEDLAGYEEYKNRKKTREGLLEAGVPQEKVDELFPEKHMSLAGKVAGFKKHALGIEEGESWSDILANPERTVEIGKKGYEAIKENGIGNTVGDLVGSAENNTGILGEMKTSFGIDVDSDIKELLGEGEDVSIKDALKDKLSGIFSKDAIEEAVEEGIDEEESGGSFVDKAKQKLSGLFGGVSEEAEWYRNGAISEEDVDPKAKMYSEFLDLKDKGMDWFGGKKEQGQGILDNIKDKTDYVKNFSFSGMSEEAEWYRNGAINEEDVDPLAKKYSKFLDFKDNPTEPIKNMLQTGKDKLISGKDSVKQNILDRKDAIAEEESWYRNDAISEEDVSSSAKIYGKFLDTKESVTNTTDNTKEKLNNVKKGLGNLGSKGKEKLSGFASKLKRKEKVYCQNCGHENDAGSEYCENCGMLLNEEKIESGKVASHLKARERGSLLTQMHLPENIPQNAAQPSAKTNAHKNAMENGSMLTQLHQPESVSQVALKSKYEFCNFCGGIIDEEDEFCPSCGVRVKDAEFYCPVCNGGVSADDEYCMHCGAELKPKSMAQKAREKIGGVFDKVKNKMNEEQEVKKAGSLGHKVEKAKKSLKDTYEGNVREADEDPNSLKNKYKNGSLPDSMHEVETPRTSLPGMNPEESLADRIISHDSPKLGASPSTMKGMYKETTPGGVESSTSILSIDEEGGIGDIASDIIKGKDPKDIVKDKIKEGISNRGGGVKGVKNLASDVMDSGKSMIKSTTGGEGGSIMDKVKGLGGGKGGKVLNKVGGVAKGLMKGGKGIGKAVGGIGKKALGGIGKKLATKGISQVGSKVLGGALMATGIGAPLGLLMESPIGGFLMEGAMNLGGKALGAVGGLVGGAGKAIGGALGGAGKAIGGLLGMGKKGAQNGLGLAALPLMGGLGLAGMAAGGLMGLFNHKKDEQAKNQGKMGGGMAPGLMLIIKIIGELFKETRKANDKQKETAKSQSALPGLLEKLLARSKENNNKTNKNNDIIGKILSALLEKKDNNKSSSDGGGVTIKIENININTDDDPEKIKTAFMNLMVELKDQVSPRIVSRTTGEAPTATTTTPSDTDTQTEENSETDTNNTNTSS